MILIQKIIADAYKPKPVITVSQWADANRELTRTSSAEPGRWRTDRFPFLREIMDNLSPMSPVTHVSVMKGAQLGFTEAGLNWIGSVIDIFNGSMLLVMPNDKVLKKNSSMRISPMLKTPVLRKKIAPASSKNGENSTFMKIFPGGILNMSSAESASGLSSTPVQNLLLDEIDRFPTNVEGEGSPVALAEKRTATFRNKKIYKISTPTEKGRSLIYKEYMKGDQRKYFCPCVHCGSFQTLEFDNLRWELDTDERTVLDAWLVCVDCGSKLYDKDKNEMLINGYWKPTNLKHKNPFVRSYQISSLYSPHGFFSFINAVEDYVKALRDKSEMVVFQNTVLGLPVEIETRKVEWEILSRKAEGYSRNSPRKEVVFLTMGIDVQRDRVECSIIGWGRNAESWHIDHRVIDGEIGDRLTHAKILSLFEENFIREDGVILKILKACIDSGDQTLKVYDFVRNQTYGDRIVAIKGQSTSGQRIYEGPTIVDKLPDGTPVPSVYLYKLNVDALKDNLMTNLKLTRYDDGTYPKGYVHFPSGYNDEFYQGITAEVYELSYNKKTGAATGAWVKKFARNEPLDCYNYARAAAALLSYDGYTEEVFKYLEEFQIKGYVEPQRQSEPRRPKASGFWAKR